MVPYSSDGDVARDIQPASGCKKPLLPHSLTHTNTRILSPATLDTAQGTESLSHLRKLAQNFPTQESVGLAGMAAMGGGMGAIDEDDDVPGQSIHRLYFFYTHTHTFSSQISWRISTRLQKPRTKKKSFNWL